MRIVSGRKAQGMPEFISQPVDHIARTTRYEDLGSFRRMFQRVTGLRCVGLRARNATEKSPSCRDTPSAMALRICRLYLIVLPLIVILGGCDKKEAAAPDVRPVRTVTVSPGDGVQRITLTGEIRARYESDL